MTIPVKLILLEGAQVPDYKSVRASGADLYAAADVIILPGETKLVPTGVRLEIPSRYSIAPLEVQIRDRSGLVANTKLRVANSPGTIDEDFRGELKVIIDNIAQTVAVPYIRQEGERYIPEIRVVTAGAVILLDGTYQTLHDENGSEYPLGTYLIRRGDRIAQAVLAAVYQMSFEQVEVFRTETARGENGLGSTGTR